MFQVTIIYAYVCRHTHVLQILICMFTPTETGGYVKTLGGGEGCT